ncbi:tRNA lysidine(34) synthetase TilS [Candidatus Gracilibacteria bacterium]|nr:tRNA lysidine(34) synthetase TilS [Candidatus Gracilibacteria bacterium]
MAVSGGPDSLALLYLLNELRHGGGPQLHVAHLDHGLRGEESAAEAHFVATTAASLGLPSTVVLRDVAALARGRNLHDAARTVRYTFFAEVTRAHAAQAVATAHHADDQAETLLLHLLRGAGPAGLSGMRSLVPWPTWLPNTPEALVGPALLRPLLNTRHAELLAYCVEHGLVPRDDPSNSAPRYTRSRLRSTILPALRAENRRSLPRSIAPHNFAPKTHDSFRASLIGAGRSLRARSALDSLLIGPPGLCCRLRSRATRCGALLASSAAAPTISVLIRG